MVAKKKTTKVETPEFDVTKFINTRFKDRTVEIDVPELKAWFKEGSKPIWIVKGLDAPEIARANEAVKANADLASLISAITSGDKSEKTEAIKDLIGVQSDKVPSDVVNRNSMLVSGSVSPKCDEELAVKLGINYATTFYKLTNKIIELTGEGKVGE